jgi:hypothetical protein
MKASDFETSNYLNAKSAGQYNGKTLTIYEVKSEQVRDIRKMVIGFEGVEKALIVNKTNRVILTDAFGDETNDWIGRSVLLRLSTVMFEGQKTLSIALDPVTQAPIIDADKKKGRK